MNNTQSISNINNNNDDDDDDDISDINLDNLDNIVLDDDDIDDDVVDDNIVDDIDDEDLGDVVVEDLGDDITLLKNLIDDDPENAFKSIVMLYKNNKSLLIKDKYKTKVSDKDIEDNVNNDIKIKLFKIYNNIVDDIFVDIAYNSLILKHISNSYNTAKLLDHFLNIKNIKNNNINIFLSFIKREYNINSDEYLTNEEIFFNLLDNDINIQKKLCYEKNMFFTKWSSKNRGPSIIKQNKTTINTDSDRERSEGQSTFKDFQLRSSGPITTIGSSTSNKGSKLSKLHDKLSLYTYSDQQRSSGIKGTDEDRILFDNIAIRYNIDPIGKEFWSTFINLKKEKLNTDLKIKMILYIISLVSNISFK